jgi:hypothetical protein
VIDAKEKVHIEVSKLTNEAKKLVPPNNYKGGEYSDGFV